MCAKQKSCKMQAQLNTISLFTLIKLLLNPKKLYFRFLEENEK